MCWYPGDFLIDIYVISTLNSLFFSQILQYRPYNRMVDWWAYGVLLYEMLIGQPPFDGEDEDELFLAIINDHLSFPYSISKEAQSFIKGVGLEWICNNITC